MRSAQPIPPPLHSWCFDQEDKTGQDKTGYIRMYTRLILIGCGLSTARGLQALNFLVSTPHLTPHTSCYFFSLTGLCFGNFGITQCRQATPCWSTIFFSYSSRGPARSNEPLRSSCIDARYLFCIVYQGGLFQFDASESCGDADLSQVGAAGPHSLKVSPP